MNCETASPNAPPVIYPSLLPQEGESLYIRLGKLLRLQASGGGGGGGATPSPNTAGSSPQMTDASATFSEKSVTVILGPTFEGTVNGQPPLQHVLGQTTSISFTADPGSSVSVTVERTAGVYQFHYVS